MSVRKVCIVITSRSTYGRLKSVMAAVDAHPDLELQTVLIASALEVSVLYKPDAVIQCLVDGDNLQAMTLTAGLLLTQIGNILERFKPDFVLVHGDRYEVLPVAIAAAYLNIPLAHTEGGEITGAIDEKVRHAITKLADVHFPVTELAARRIMAMGERPEMVFVVGSTALDALVGINLTPNRDQPYLVVLHHPNTTREENFSELLAALREVQMPKVWVNPNVDPGSKAMLKLIHREDVEFVKNLPPEEYARLIYNCACLVGNTSSGIKEGAFLGVPYVCVGGRQEGREHGGNVILVDYDKEAILEAIMAQMRHGKYPQDFRFGDGMAGKRIADVLARVEVGEKKLYIPWVQEALNGAC